MYKADRDFQALVSRVCKLDSAAQQSALHYLLGGIGYYIELRGKVSTKELLSILADTVDRLDKGGD